MRMHPCCSALPLPFPPSNQVLITTPLPPPLPYPTPNYSARSVFGQNLLWQGSFVYSPLPSRGFSFAPTNMFVLVLCVG